MKNYHVTIYADRYPTQYTVQASGWPTAIARAIREWKRRFKGSRTNELKITAVKSSPLLIADKDNE